MVVPDDGYLNGAHKLLKKHNALLIADEVQVGLCGWSLLLRAVTACTSMPACDTVPQAVAIRPKQARRPAVWHPRSSALCICRGSRGKWGQQQSLVGSSCPAAARAAQHGLHVCTLWEGPLHADTTLGSQ